MKNYDDSILLINKDSELMSNFSIILGEFGYNLRVALDGDTAVDIINQKKIDLVIIDFTFEEIKPYVLFDEIIRLKPEIPRIVIVTKELLDDPEFNKIYPYIYDIVIKPVNDINDFRMRVRRGIENTKLLKENRAFQKMMVEKTFRIGMLDILSSIMNQVNNDVDGLLAYLYLWKEDCSSSFNNESESKKFNERFNEFMEKILSIEEKIQLNEVLLSEHTSEKGIFIDVMLEDIVSTMKETFKSFNINVSISLDSLKPTKLDSLKVVQCFFYLLENSLSFLKKKPGIKKIKIECKPISSDNEVNQIETLIFDNSESPGIADRLRVFEKDYYSDALDKRFGLYDIKEYIDSIGGSIDIKSSSGGIRTRIILPVI